MNNIRKYCLFDIQKIVNKHLDYSEYLQLIVFMFNQYELIEISEYVKKYKVNDKTVRNRIESGKIPYLILGKTFFIIEKMIV